MMRLPQQPSALRRFLGAHSAVLKFFCILPSLREALFGPVVSIAFIQ
jgi:hypothetical protein